MKLKQQLLILIIFSIEVIIAQAPTNGLIGSWPFNGNSNDESINSNNGTIHGATLTTDRFGNLNSAYNFDGIDDYINLGNNSNLSRYNSDFTLSVWVRRNTTPQGYTQPIFTNRIDDSGSEIYISGQLNGYPGHLGYATYNGSSYGITRTNNPIMANNQYEHLVVVYNYNGNNNNTVKLYINNELKITKLN